MKSTNQICRPSSSRPGNKKGFFKTALVQPKLKLNQPGDNFEKEANSVADSVMSQPNKNETPTFFEARPLRAASLQRKAWGNGDTPISSNSIQKTINSNGHPIDHSTRSFMERRFGHDFGNVQIHNDSQAHQSSSDIGAKAYTSANHVAFGPGMYRPGTLAGNWLLAHELAHVIQQSGGRGNVVQKSPADDKKYGSYEDYEKLVTEHKWCRDSEWSGSRHPGQQCFRELTDHEGFHEADQACFDKKTKKFIEGSPDIISAVSGQNLDGTCKIDIGLRALGHGGADVCSSEPDLCGGYLGAYYGALVGNTIPSPDLPSPVMGERALFPLLGAYAFKWAFAKAMPPLTRYLKHRGYVPTYSLGIGTRQLENVRLDLGTGFQQAEDPLPIIPVKTYLTFGLDSSIQITDEGKTSSAIIGKIGIRVDPGEPGGFVASQAVGAGLRLGSDIAPVITGEVGIGWQPTSFMDIQFVGTKDEGDNGMSMMLRLNLFAPNKFLKTPD
jgi:hypothetical protein